MSTTNFAGNDALLPLIPLDKSAYGACRYKKQILSISLQQEIRAAYIERQSRPDGEIYHEALNNFEVLRKN